MDSPDFPGLVRFLVEPFLDSPDSLRIDCEENAAQAKVWIRIAFKGDERGKVFGRGGRNIQAIRGGQPTWMSTGPLSPMAAPSVDLQKRRRDRPLSQSHSCALNLRMPVRKPELRPLV